MSKILILNISYEKDKHFNKEGEKLAPGAQVSR